VAEAMEALRQADAFKAVASWCYAFRLGAAEPSEGAGDGLDEGCGQKVLSVLRRFALQGLLLVVSRWQDYGATSGLEEFGTELYGMVMERCKDLIKHLKQAVGLNSQVELPKLPEKPPPAQMNFDFSFLPPLPEPRVPTKFGPNHFLSDTSLNRPASLPHLFSGGDVRLWMANDQILRNLPESEIWALRFLRQPDHRVERVVQAIAMLRGQKVPSSASTAAARWGYCREVLKSPTLRTELLLFDAGSASAEAAQHALELLAGLDASDIRRVSVGVAALFEWAQGTARWRLEGPASVAGAEQGDGTSLQPVQVRETVFRSASSPMLRRASSGPRLRRCFASGDSAFRKHVQVPVSPAAR